MFYLFRRRFSTVLYTFWSPGSSLVIVDLSSCSDVLLISALSKSLPVISSWTVFWGKFLYLVILAGFLSFVCHESLFFSPSLLYSKEVIHCPGSSTSGSVSGICCVNSLVAFWLLFPTGLGSTGLILACRGDCLDL